jgi:phage shock protein A
MEGMTMGILTRFKDIMASNINAMLDKAEDPEKMIDQYMRNLESDLGKVKAETASVMAEETRAKRELDDCNEQIAKMQSYAEKALLAGNEADARSFLEKKQQLANTQAALQKAYDIAKDNSTKMRQMHDKLVKDIDTLESRRTAIKATMKAAKAQERINEVGSSYKGAGNDLEAFDRMEAKANKMLDEANAMAELNQSASDANIDNLAAKYEAAPSNAAVDDELAALKAKLGL